MTAAHCFCRDEEESVINCKTVKREGKLTSQPAYDVSRMINIVIGINNMKVTEAVRNQGSVYRPAEVEQVSNCQFIIGITPAGFLKLHVTSL